MLKSWIFGSIAVVFIILSSQNVSARILPKTQAQKLIESIPAEDREAFITSQIAKAVQKLHRNDIFIYNKRHQPQTLAVFSDQEDIFKDLDVPEEFCTDLLEWVEDNMVAFSRRPSRGPGDGAVCNPNGCVDPGDIGQICCPF